MRRQYIFIRTRKERSPMSEWVVICLTIIMICPRILHEMCIRDRLNGLRLPFHMENGCLLFF